MLEEQYLPVEKVLSIKLMGETRSNWELIEYKTIRSFLNVRKVKDPHYIDEYDNVKSIYNFDSVYFKTGQQTDRFIIKEEYGHQFVFSKPRVIFEYLTEDKERRLQTKYFEDVNVAKSYLSDFVEKNKLNHLIKI